MSIWPKKKTSMLVYVPVALVSIGALGAGVALLRASAQKRTEKKRKQEEKDIGRWENEGGNPSATARPNSSVKSKDFTSVQG